MRGLAQSYKDVYAAHNSNKKHLIGTHSTFQFHALLTFPDGISWWYANGIDCSTSLATPLAIEPVAPPNATAEIRQPQDKSSALSELTSWLRPADQTEVIEGLCWPDFKRVESVQAGIQVLLSVSLLFALFTSFQLFWL